jgi:hypothetical protein
MSLRVENETPVTSMLRVQDIVSGAYATTEPVIYAAANESICPSADAGAKDLSVYFFFIDSEGNPQGTAAVYPIAIDPNAAPSIASAGSASSGGSCAVPPAGNAAPGAGIFGLGAAAAALAVVRRRRARPHRSPPGSRAR